MTDTAAADQALQGDSGIIAELESWLASNWDPDLTVGEWWERLGTAGWSAPYLPEHAYGRGLLRADANRVAEVIGEFGALGAPGGLGLLLAAPTIAAHGTQEQIDLYVRDIVTGKKAWCQLFSEPAAGSDLAGLQARAVRDGDEWIVNGQKVWTSGGQIADLGMLLARTDPDVPKHQGISYFAIDMHQPGVDVRPLREMTGRALFNEVFLTEARVADAALIGGMNQGWAVANTTLANERAGLGSGGGNAAGGVATPGTVVGDLERRAGDFVRSGKRSSGRRSGGEGSLLGASRGGADLLIALARATDQVGDPIIRQELARLYTWGELGRFNSLRLKAAKEAGRDIPGMPNIAKLSMSQIMRMARDLGMQIAGAAGTLHAYDDEGRAGLTDDVMNPMVKMVTEIALFAQAPPIYGGTDQVQRNIIGERVLGLPKEPNNDRTTPFSELPKNN
ncbi:MAG: acyl-CoA dehydrogenase family protein [Actinomycetota bacterium]|nr:acyl-CoA dehydrogenase family protein [Actinomycetota bacterium]